MIKLKIGLDLDGVSANFTKGVCELFDRLKISHKPLNSKEDIIAWHFEDWMGVTKEQVNKVWAEIDKSKMFWLNLSLIDPEGWKLLIENLANREDIELFFVTARTLGKNLREQTFKWLQMQGIKYPTLIFCDEKIKLIESLKLDYYIDDSPAFFEKIPDIMQEDLTNMFKYSECKAFKYNYPYNKHIKRSLTVENLKEFVEYIIKEQNI